MSNPGTREFRSPRKPIRPRQQHHNSSGNRVTVTIPSNPGEFGFYENKSAAVSAASQMRSKTVLRSSVVYKARVIIFCERAAGLCKRVFEVSFHVH